MSFVAMVSYGVGALAFSALALLLLTRLRGRLSGYHLPLACAVSAAWAALLAVYAGPTISWPAVVAEVARGAVWLSLLLGLLATRGGAGVPRRARLLVHTIWLGVLGYILVRSVVTPGQGVAYAFLLGAFVIALTGLVLVEQLFRNTVPERRWAVKYLCLGVGGMFAFDLYLYADALLFGAPSEELWLARGMVNALVAPLIGIAAARGEGWKPEVMISRRLAFYTTSLAAVGIYLLAMAAGGYYVRLYGGSWGTVVQIVFLFGAALILVVTLFSGQARARLKVFLSKHFYSYKYDYREEWLKLIRALFVPGSDQALPVRAARAVADLVESPLAGVWILRDGYYVPAGGDLAGPDSAVEPAGSAMVKLLTEQEWIVDLDARRSGTARHLDTELPQWLTAEQRAWLVLPLLQERELVGFMVLARPRVKQQLTWEDFDLLKTVGRQVAAVLAQHEAAQQLAQTRQFETYNRLAAFIVHDVKNVIQQQSLLVRNAERHKHDPEFVEDMIGTIDNSVQRMSRLLEQLRRGAMPGGPRLTSLSSLCEAVAGSCSQRRPVPRVVASDESLPVRVPRESVSSVLAHLVRNAQDATAEHGRVELRLSRDGQEAVLEIVDDGCGMSEQFVRERLFKPFESTKGSKGMGIGAYQAREIIRAQGGEIQVHSRPGEGTVVRIRLPLAEQSGTDEAQIDAPAHAKTGVAQ